MPVGSWWGVRGWCIGAFGYSTTGIEGLLRRIEPVCPVAPVKGTGGRWERRLLGPLKPV